MIANTARLVVRASQPDTLDHAAVVAVDGDGEGSIVGRATLSRLYGLRAEIEVELTASDAVTIALIDALEQEARRRRLARLELAARSVSRAAGDALRQGRRAADEHRGDVPYLSWSTTPVSS